MCVYNIYIYIVYDEVRLDPHQEFPTTNSFPFIFPFYLLISFPSHHQSTSVLTSKLLRRRFLLAATGAQSGLGALCLSTSRKSSCSSAAHVMSAHVCI